MRRAHTASFVALVASLTMTGSGAGASDPADDSVGVTASVRPSATAQGSYRFVDPPVVVYAMLPGPVYHVVFRLNHYLARDRLGVRASVELNQTGDPTKPINFSRPRACYLQELEVGPPDPVLKHPKTGRPVTVRLRIKAPVQQTLTTRARLHRVSRAAFDAPDGAGAFRPAGC
ncbi:MAG: hypothetical protein JWP53_2734 [Conexibacter sp.]|jgi:hypothetical protein|nr:hypothetical protein [Conexibacter sp.]